MPFQIRCISPLPDLCVIFGFSGEFANQALCVTSNENAQCDEKLACNADESDTRIWLHVFISAGQRETGT